MMFGISHAIVGNGFIRSEKCLVGAATTGLDMHFARRAKLRFGSVQPSPATLVRVAFDLFESLVGTNKKDTQRETLRNTHSLFQGERLGQWINKQRTDYMNRGTQKENAEFTEERITDLEAIGMVWDVNNYKWNRMYDVAKRYYNLYGNLEVPAAQEFEGIKLGKWLSNQRSSYRGYKGRKTLTADQIEKLNELNFKW